MRNFRGGGRHRERLPVPMRERLDQAVDAEGKPTVGDVAKAAVHGGKVVLDAAGNVVDSAVRGPVRGAQAAGSGFAEAFKNDGDSVMTPIDVIANTGEGLVRGVGGFIGGSVNGTVESFKNDEEYDWPK